MNSRSKALMIIGVGVGLLVAAPDGARAQEEPQGGCRSAGEFIASLARQGGFGEFSSELAGLGLRDDFAQGLQSALCDPRS